MKPKISAQWLAGLAGVLFLASVFLQEYLPGLAILPLLLLIFLTIDERVVFVLILFALIALPYDIGEQIRAAINLSSFSFLSYLYVREHGLTVAPLRELPRAAALMFGSLLLSMAISTLLSEYPYAGVQETIRQTVFIVLILLVWSYVNTDEKVKLLFYSIILSGVFTACVIIYSFLTTPGALYYLQTFGFIHEGGVFGNVAAAGGVFCVSIPVTIAYVTARQGRAKKNGFVSSLLVVLLLLGIFLTNSRAAVVGTLAGVLLFAVIRNFKKTMITLSAFAVTGYLLVLLTPADAIIKAYFRSERILENTRYYLWDISADVIRGNAVFGVGPGAFKNYMYKFLPVMPGTWDEKQIDWVYTKSGLGHQHNFFLFRWSELGIGGIASALFFLYLFFYYPVRTYLFSKRNGYYGDSLSAGIICAGAGMVIRGIFEATGIISHGWIGRDLPLWLLFIAAMRYSRLFDDGDNHNIAGGAVK